MTNKRLLRKEMKELIWHKASKNPPKPRDIKINRKDFEIIIGWAVEMGLRIAENPNFEYGIRGKNLIKDKHTMLCLRSKLQDEGIWIIH